MPHNTRALAQVQLATKSETTIYLRNNNRIKKKYSNYNKLSCNAVHLATNFFEHITIKLQ